MQKSAPFEVAIESRYPEQIAFAIARTPTGKYNPITLGWVMPASLDPPMFAIAVGKSRYSLECIRQAGAFTLAFPSENQAGAARLFGSRSGRDLDKFKAAANLRTERARHIDSLILVDAVANFECRVEREIDSGDHVIFLGAVLCAYETTNPLNRLYTLVKSLHMGGLNQTPVQVAEEHHG